MKSVHTQISVSYRLTIRKQAPSMTAFIFTSRSIGNEIPKLSVSVNASFKKPDHCLEILPILEASSKVFTCFNRKLKKKLFKKALNCVIKLMQSLNATIGTERQTRPSESQSEVTQAST